MDPSLPETRIGDRERREVDARLQQAHGDGVLTLSEYDERAAQCWAARTRSELDVLTQDLPRPDGPTPQAVADGRPAASAAPAKRPALAKRAGNGLLVVVLAGAGLFLGARAVTADDGAAIFSQGGEVQVANDQERVEVGVVFGSMRVVVPDGARVRTGDRHMFGSVDCEAACAVGGAGPEIVVDTRGAFGSVDILTRDEDARGVDLDRDADDEKDNDDDNDNDNDNGGDNGGDDGGDDG